MDCGAQIVTGERGPKLTLAGELHIRAAGELLRALRDAQQLEVTEVDLAAVECCDAALLQLFSSAAATACNAGRPLEFVNVPDRVLQSAAALGLCLFSNPNQGRGSNHAV